MQFNYSAKTKQGEMQSGVVEALNREGAVDALQTRELIILALNPVSNQPVFARQIKFFQKVKSKELVAFSRQLSILFAAQVPLLASLETLVRQTPNPYFRDILFEVANDVEGGATFSKALARHPKVFSTFIVNMVKSGETSGSLENSLSYLADYLEKQFYLVSRVRGAMTYPAFILCGFLIVATVMMIVVVPQLTSFLKETGQELPLATRVIIALSNFLRSFWWLFALVIFGGVGWIWYQILKSAAARSRWDEIKLKLPIFGKIFQKIYLTRLAENLSTLIQGGLSILQALQVSSEVVGNTVFQKIILQAKEEVRVGTNLSTSFSRHKEIPPLVTQMIATGEQTGSIDFILKKMAQFYSKEVDATVDTLSQLIEPILITVIGAGVAVLVAAILMPIYNIAGGM